jgi:hypothetical protein
MDDPDQGKALCRPQSGMRVRAFGSNHGTVVYASDRRSGNTIDELRLGINSWVEQVAIKVS